MGIVVISFGMHSYLLRSGRLKKQIMDLDELDDMEFLNRRAYNVCKGNRLLDLKTLIAYYRSHGTFISLLNCGAKTNIELIAICKKYIEREEAGVTAFQVDNPLNISVEELNRTHKYKRNGFSKRTLIVCKLNQLNSLRDILEHYERSGTYTNLTKTGRNTTAELVSIFNEYHRKYQKYLDNNRLNDRPLKDIERTTINSFIQVEMNQLSIRCANGIRGYLSNNLDYVNFQERIFKNPKFHVRTMKNVGLKSAEEIYHFLDSVIAYAQEATGLEDEEEKEYFKNKITLQRLFPSGKISEDVLESNAILTIVDYLIQHDAIFKSTRSIVFQKCLTIYNNESPQSLEAAADDVGLTRERIRQIRVGILRKLLNTFEFVNELYDPFIEELAMNDNSPFIWMDTAFADRLNSEYNTRFSPEFLTVLVGAMKAAHFSVIGDLSDVLVKNESTYRTRHNWKGIYLVNREFADCIDFDGIVNELESKTSPRIDKTITLDFYTSLKPYLKPNGNQTFEEITPIIEQIILAEFALVSVSAGLIHLHKNTIKLAYEYAYEALDALGKSASVDAIALKAMELNPGYITSGDQIRAAMSRSKGFLPIGRSSKFGLKKWEKERESFKGGTIREIVSDFLEQQAEPVAMDKIADYVLQYRPRSNANSIYSNLHLEATGRFVFFNKSKLGLSSKTYSSRYEAMPAKEKRPTRTWDEWHTDFQDFLDTHERLPYSTSVPRFEKSLYRWWRNQYNDLEKNKLNADQAAKIKGVVSKYYAENMPSERKPSAKPDAYSPEVRTGRGETSRGQIGLFDEV